MFRTFWLLFTTGCCVATSVQVCLGMSEIPLLLSAVGALGWSLVYSIEADPEG
jgi:hypothetical protein